MRVKKKWIKGNEGEANKDDLQYGYHAQREYIKMTMIDSKLIWN